MGDTWPVAGRTIGLVAGPGVRLDTLRTLRAAVREAEMVPLVVGATGGVLHEAGDMDGDVEGDEAVHVQDTFATARSVDYDALILVGGALGRVPDGHGSRDARAGEPADPAGPVGENTVDPRVALLLTEAYRHAKPLAAVGDSPADLARVGIRLDAPCVLAAADTDGVVDRLAALLAAHRVWDRFPAVE